MNSRTAATQPLAPEAPAAIRFPGQIKYIIGHEACERFSYYGVLGLFVALATVIFWLGRKKYIRQPPCRSSETVGLGRIFGYGLARLGVCKISLTPAQENDAKAVWRILMIFCTVPMF